MRATARVVGLAGLLTSSVFVATLTADGARAVVRRAPLDAYGVLCAHVAGESVPTADRGRTQDVVYTGVVISESDLVAGTLTVLVRVIRDGRARASYTGHITVHPAALAGSGGWEGRFGGALRGSDARRDLASLGTELLHRRTVRVRRNPSTIRVPGPPPTRITRRLLRGTGALEGMRLVFDHPANEGVAPPPEALPGGCATDYERWTGVLLDVRPEDSRSEPWSAAP